MAATWDSADLLALFNQEAGRPTTDTVSDPTKYALLAKSQNRVVMMMGAVVPNSLYPKVAYGSLPTLTTTDNQVYTFGSDASGYANFPMGHGGIYRSLNDIPSNPLVPGQDYMIEGTQIRCPNNNTLPSTLYWYGIAQPTDLDATHQPALFPEASRELIVIDAVRRFSQAGKRDFDLMTAMQNEWDRAWPLWTLAWRTQFKSGGALNVFTGRSLAVFGGFSGL